MKVDMLGKKFHRLTILSGVESDNRGNAMWKAKCECGNIKNYRGTSLINTVAAVN